MALFLFTLFYSSQYSYAAGSDKKNQNLLLGKWSGINNYEEEGMLVSFSDSITYMRKGKSMSEGEMVATLSGSNLEFFGISIEDGPLDLYFSFALTSEWEIKDGYLIETVVDFNLIPDARSDDMQVAHNFIDALNESLSIEGSFVTSYEIIRLNRRKLVTKNEETGEISRYVRVE